MSGAPRRKSRPYRKSEIKETRGWLIEDETQDVVEYLQDQASVIDDWLHARLEMEDLDQEMTEE